MFYEQKDYLHKENELYITIFVPCQVSSSTQRSGFLIVNVHEKIFRNIFSATMEKSGGEVYILNDRGKILSSTRTDLIQTEYLLKDNIRKDEKEHYFAVDGTYAISYEISWIHWNIIWERPIEDFYSEADYLYRILIAFILISLILVLFCYGLYMKVLLKPLNKLIGAMQDVGKGQYGIILNEKCEGEIGHVIRSFNEMSQDIANLTKENARVNNEKRTLQLLALQEQMSPHFVLNALNTIKWMATLAKEKNIVNMVIALSKVIYNFKNTSPFGTIGEEIDFVKNYIIVMNYRYGDVITVNYDVEDKLLNVSIPIFFIQPLVENSLKHGFESTNCQGHIRIRVWEENEKIFIRVTDNGSGLTKEKQDELKNKFERATQTPFNETGGVGLMNIAKRIQLYYGEEYGICIENTKEKGAQFLITLPYRREP